MHNKLTAILKTKEQEVITLKETIKKSPNSDLAKIFHGEITFQHPQKNVTQVLTYGEFIKVIAEIKRRSPSKGALAEIADPLLLAKEYTAGGATAISILTDAAFDGKLADLKMVSNTLKNSNIPLLRKDFLIDPLQIAESILYGADLILLIVAILGDELPNMLKKARELNIPALVEVHTQEEIKQAIDAGADIIGVNNRNLKTFEIDTQCAFDLLEYLPKSAIKIAESGIFTVDLAKKYHEAGYAAVLVGEALVKSNNPAEWIANCRLG